jgi:hypothetical protein
MEEKELEALKASNPKAYEFIVSQKGELEKLKAAPPKKDDPPAPPAPKKDDPDLLDKVRAKNESDEKEKAKLKGIESAMRFNLSIGDFVKANADVLPSDVEKVIKEAEKENYDSAVERARALKVPIIKAFFDVQANLELLTDTQKTQLGDYQKLTKAGREERADYIYENLLEPALGTMKKLKKAEEVGRARSGLAPGGKAEEDYRNRLVEGSRKFYLGDKGAQ